jgi:predicted nucleotidyltransferase component of viral defense system
MRTISGTQWQSLEDLSAEGLLGGLSPQTAEKDIHITELLGALSTLEVRHSHFKGLARDKTAIDDGIQLIFAGGTCLSKAHRLTSRMSEDVDIKILLSEPNRELKTGIGDRARLKALHRQIIQTVDSLGLSVPAELNGAHNPRFRDEHRYGVIDIAYESKGPPILSLRPELKLEIIHREPRLESSQMEFGYLYEHIAGLQPSRTVAMACISVGETLAEKVLSLLRRCAMDWAKAPKRKMDPALVRHIYDVHRITTAQPRVIDEASRVFAAAVAQDAQEYRGIHTAFDDDPISVLHAALEQAKTNANLRTQYAEKVLPLVYDQQRPSYEVAFTGFENAARHLLGTLAGG